MTVLLLTSGFAVWASQATNAAAAQAADASALSDAYADAATAVAAEESLERLYLTEPSPDVEAAYDQQAGAFATAVRRVQRLGDSSDRAVVARASAAHAALTRATMSLFRAFDRGDTERAQRIDLEDVDPPRATLEKAVSGAAESSHATTLALLAHLRDLERRTQLLTPLVFVIGVVIATLLVIVSRGDRRLLMAERAQARHDSLHDPLCGLPNRRLLTERLDQSLRKSDAGPAGDPALLLIDLDRFKEVNDTFGHRYGDELLIQVGSRLTRALRPVDTVARLGGDEFAVLIPHVLTLAEALRTAAELRATLEPSFHVFGVDLNVEASVGVVLAPQHGEDSVTLIQRADIAMYEAKASGSGVCSYERDIDRHSPGRLALLGELRGALERGELVLHYQPQLATGTGEVVGAEALVRWQHPTRGMVFPGEFIPLAEHTGLIGPLTRYVLSAALAQARTWADSGRPLRVSVNLSAKNLLDEHVADMVQGLLAMHGVDPHLLRLEVTESAMVDDSVRATRTLDRLAALPVSLSIDDFGAGYTSLGQLKALPVGELKIDKSFVLTMTDDPADAHIVEGIIAIGHRLGKTIVAEGVETEGALLALRQAGCDVAQGYLFSRPVPVEAFDTWRADRAAASAPPWGAGAGPAPLRPGLTAAAAPTSTPV